MCYLPQVPTYTVVVMNVCWLSGDMRRLLKTRSHAWGHQSEQSCVQKIITL